MVIIFVWLMLTGMAVQTVIEPHLGCLPEDCASVVWLKAPLRSALSGSEVGVYLSRIVSEHTVSVAFDQSSRMGNDGLGRENS